MTQELYQEAMKFAGEKHSEQTVPGTTANYLLHLSNVAMEILLVYAHSGDFDIDFAVQVAILHDTIEDTSATYVEIETKFGSQIAKAVLALTKSDDFSSKKEAMDDSLKRINLLEKEVGMVKLADRITNLQKPPEHWSDEKVSLYLEGAKGIANALPGKNEYLLKRLLLKIDEYDSYV